jgi:hypothetical protein
MIVRTPLEKGEFSTVGTGHVLAIAPVVPGTLVLGQKFQIVCMFEVWEVKQNDVLVGFYFQSAFKVENKSGYLLTCMESKRGQARTHTQVLRDDKNGLIVWDFGGCGALAVSTKVSALVNDILETQ